MAQSVRRPATLGAMDHEPQRDKARTSYFGNVKTRLGSKLPAGVSQPPQFAKRPWETQPPGRVLQEAAASSQLQNQSIVCRPLNHIPHIRNPKLRQYYLPGTSWDLNNTVVTVGGPSDDGPSSKGLPGDSVFSVSSKFNSNAPSAEESDSGHRPSFTSTKPSSSSATLIARELVVPRGKNTSTSDGSSHPELDSDPKESPEEQADQDCLNPLAAQPQSPSPEAEYDKLLDVEAVPMPDGQLCLLALPPECCEGEGPEPMPYLKLICRYITDRKGVVSGILLVTSNKIFFDPCKTHPLVKEHGCEEYLLSYSVDNLASVSFFSDISHVHFSTSQQRRKGIKIFQKLKPIKTRLLNQKGESCPPLVSAAASDLSSLALNLTKEVSEDEEAESRDMAEAERELASSPVEVLAEASVGSLGVAVLSSAATFCCGSQEVASKANMDLLHAGKREKTSVKNQTAAPQRSSAGGLMFVRLRVQPSAGKKKGVGGLQLGSTKTLSRRDAWLALSQDSSDELYAYLKDCRPDLCILEGVKEDGEADHDEEEFVLIEDKEEEEDEDEDELLQRHSGDDWEMVLMEESRDKPTLPVTDRDPEGLSDIVESSKILEASHVREITFLLLRFQLCKELPPRMVGHTWQLAYSMSHHGASLKSLYRKLSDTDSPVVIVIKDALDEIFGAFLSDPLRPSETFYGTGETFLFMLHPRFKCFKWTGENSFFIKGDLDCFAIGGGSGHFGLWVDGNLYLGRSSPCYTFNNCCLSETDDFRVMELEVWKFS
ncbi:nuclear receptor coactivator 7 isoform X2 [Archocentrus centrarchus]|uniref:nuclear receptor coactivator 7 isoform X2 n=1 Tax=Archocentrus centrarchus TaxID=63155 RepID=UPI0011EA0A30|nr:nuclear receptor coactivator 7-like isoform X2 [Archocentrus centrarchus]